MSGHWKQASVHAVHEPKLYSVSIMTTNIPKSISTANRPPSFQPMTTSAPSTVLRLPAVRMRVGISRTSIYQRMSEGTFPKPIHLGPKSVGWLEHEVDAWLADCIAQSRPAAAGRAQ